MADQPDPPDEWRVYKSDPTPDPEPADTPPPHVPYGSGPHVPYGAARAPGSGVPPVVARSRSVAPRLLVVAIAVALIGAGIAGVAAIFSAVGDGIGFGGIDAKDPDDFAALIDKLEEEKGTTVVQEVNFYTDYIIVYMPYTDDPGDDRQISYTWRGHDLEEWTRGTSTEPTFDLEDIDPEVIDGMCDPVLDLAEEAKKDDCYVFLDRPEDGQAWFRASASDDFGRSVQVTYDKDGKELERTCNGLPCT
ncbi:hypothetical protein [Nocardioides sp. MH1]|uniref:hypothetical protein n=1 Tax=Nocardioides sp. MH1 TaxID=3242490 RepID=UPI00352164A3